MNRDLQYWLLEEGERLLKKVGIRRGDLVLDFGCGRGCYSIPAAKIVGDRGTVFALEKSKYLVNELIGEASSRGLRNVVPARCLDELKRILAGKRLNAVLFYDVIHSYYFTCAQRKSLLQSVAPLVAGNGLVSIFPRHMSTAEVREVGKTLHRLGFLFQTHFDAELVHDERYTSGRIYNFRKRIAARRAFTARSAQ
jgi:SAM-dependent methyltransferase